MKHITLTKVAASLSEIKLKYLFTALIISLCTALAGTETVTLRTWYPSPYGVYQKMKISNTLTVGSAANPASLSLYGSATVTGNAAVAVNSGSQLTVGTTDKAPAIGGNAFAANVGGYLHTDDAYFRKINKWASELGGAIYSTGISAKPTSKASNPTGTITLPVGKTYTLLIWMYYFNCEDYTTNLTLDGTTVHTYYGAGSDTGGCDQNSVFHIQTGVAGGTHALGSSWGVQRTFMWLAYPAN